MGVKKPYNKGSIERALEVHLKAGRIKHWSTPPPGGRTYTVELYDFGTWRGSSLAEVYALVVGLRVGQVHTERQAQAVRDCDNAVHLEFADGTTATWRGIADDDMDNMSDVLGRSPDTTRT